MLQFVARYLNAQFLFLIRDQDHGHLSYGVHRSSVVLFFYANRPKLLPGYRGYDIPTALGTE